MRTLQLLRHGKSDWGAGAADHERPLNDRGRRAADAVGRYVAETGQVPDRVLTSSATRAHTTAERAIAAGRWDVELLVLDDLYLPSVDGVLTVVAEHGGDAGTLLVVGHEPTWSGLVGHLTSAVVRYPTAALAVVDLLVSRWDEVDLGVRGELRAFLPPRLLPGNDG
jgi:phosphohistidine phosphatase